MYRITFFLAVFIFCSTLSNAQTNSDTKFKQVISNEKSSSNSVSLPNFGNVNHNPKTGSTGVTRGIRETAVPDAEPQPSEESELDPSQEPLIPFGSTSSTISNRTHSTANTRVVGGNKAKPWVLEHLVLIIIRDRSGNTYTCTGTILSRKWVLSAAHCFDSVGTSEDVDESETYVYISPKVLYPSFAVKRYLIKSAFVHDDYAADNWNFKNDIALVELWDAIDTNKYKPVRIGFEPEPRTETIVAGYGVKNEQGEEPIYAQQATVLAMDFETCAARENDNEVRFLDKKVHVCAVSLGFPDKGLTDTCYGDSGGPLFAVKQGKLYQYGITSYSTQACAEPGSTPWYTRVSNYRDTLEEIRRGRTARIPRRGPMKQIFAFKRQN